MRRPWVNLQNQSARHSHRQPAVEQRPRDTSCCGVIVLGCRAGTGRGAGAAGTGTAASRLAGARRRGRAGRGAARDARDGCAVAVDVAARDARLVLDLEVDTGAPEAVRDLVGGVCKDLRQRKHERHGDAPVLDGVNVALQVVVLPPDLDRRVAHLAAFNRGRRRVAAVRVGRRRQLARVVHRQVRPDPGVRVDDVVERVRRRYVGYFEKGNVAGLARLVVGLEQRDDGWCVQDGVRLDNVARRRALLRREFDSVDAFRRLGSVLGALEVGRKVKVEARQGRIGPGRCGQRDQAHGDCDPASRSHSVLGEGVNLRRQGSEKNLIESGQWRKRSKRHQTCE